MILKSKTLCMLCRGLKIYMYIFVTDDVQHVL